ncbi:hypothetical protein ACP70R_021200 [Stipagrostis hirtigluma subsp. patula]
MMKPQGGSSEVVTAIADENPGHGGSPHQQHAVDKGKVEEVDGGSSVRRHDQHLRESSSVAAVTVVADGGCAERKLG